MKLIKKWLSEKKNTLTKLLNVNVSSERLEEMLTKNQKKRNRKKKK